MRGPRRSGILGVPPASVVSETSDEDRMSVSRVLSVRFTGSSQTQGAGGVSLAAGLQSSSGTDSLS